MPERPLFVNSLNPDRFRLEWIFRQWSCRTREKLERRPEGRKATLPRRDKLALKSVVRNTASPSVDDPDL
jgi:hypothetical protein